MRIFIYALIIISLISLSAISFFYLGSGNTQEFFTSLSTNIIAIVITLAGVEGIIWLHEKRIWEKVDSKVLEDILLINMGLIGRINDSLKIPKELFDTKKLKSSDCNVRNNELVTFLAEKMTDELILDKVNSAADTSILKIESNFQIILQEYNSILNTFGSRFDPKILNPLLDLKRTLFTTIEFIRSFKIESDIFMSENINFNSHLTGRISNIKKSLIVLILELNSEIDYNKLSRQET
ncbi:hypothetical protein [Rhodohalobacter sp. 614A]|uniref:hypothetical protein n=1 Tax=Rhodohalobacter sp. 614A TaxID=2908649 RepID=UPI001F1B124F|nr:hypothetical protein [Rhodohalobacter sp. 614A]